VRELTITELGNRILEEKKKERDEGKNEEFLLNKPIRDGESP
jgi:hypothetical protein